MTNHIYQTILIEQGKATKCASCKNARTPEQFQVNGLGRRMNICQICYEQLFAMGPFCVNSTKLAERIEQIKAAAHQGLRDLRRPKIVLQSACYGYSRNRR